MRSVSLFASRLGTDFDRLDAHLQWVHGGESRDLRGIVTVERGSSLLAKALCLLTSLPPALKNAPIHIRIEAADHQERWTRTYAGRHVMTSTLIRSGDCLVERLGPAAITFRLRVSNAGIDWQLQHVSMLGIPLPLSWFLISARIDWQDEQYHFLIDSGLRGIGLIVRYEGLLNAEA